jgi:hypothetical protein
VQDRQDAYDAQVTGYDWNRLPAPSRFLQKVADHRVVTRAVLFAIDAALVGIVLVAIITLGEARWWWFLLLVIWASQTYQFGWAIPHQVDRWREQESGTTAPPA